MTEIYRNDLIYSISYALDFVEQDVVMVSTHHSKRVAYLSAAMGRTLGYETAPLLDLAACGALHDNALPQYEQHRTLRGESVEPESFERELGIHCELGEENISGLSFYPGVRGAILYHHENADGSGPFGRTAQETPVFSRLIHIADTVDARFDLSRMTREKFGEAQRFVRASTGTLYDSVTAEAFRRAFPAPETLRLDAASLDGRLQSELPELKAGYEPDELMRLAGLFSKIIDFKSPFTCRHSGGIAEKARRMGAYYGWDADTQARLYLAGALHDVGKLMVRSEILEKPGRLTDDEYRDIQAHAYGSYTVLHGIRGLEDIASWAYLHHEKLDGSGYPFGRTAAELGEKERLIACLDIYQALREERPYKSGSDHREAMAVLRGMAAEGKLDARIVGDIDLCFAEEAAIA